LLHTCMTECMNARRSSCIAVKRGRGGRWLRLAEFKCVCVRGGETVGINLPSIGRTEKPTHLCLPCLVLVGRHSASLAQQYNDQSRRPNRRHKPLTRHTGAIAPGSSATTSAGT
jgi:hypothetical protein